MIRVRAVVAQNSKGVMAARDEPERSGSQSRRMSLVGRQYQFVGYESCRSGRPHVAIQQVSSLRRTADVGLDSRATSGIGGSGHRLAKAQRCRSA